MQEQQRILKMLEEGKIDAIQAEKLLAAIKNTESSVTASANPSFLCVQVTPKVEGGDQVSVRVPLKVIKAGMKLGALMPDKVKTHTQNALGEKGIHFDLDNLNAENVDEFLKSLADLSVDVDSESESVKVYCC